QGLFQAFEATTKPETSWTYEVGARSNHSLSGLLSGFSGQISYYHVDFSNRLLGISPTATISGIAGIVSGAAIVQNVGSVTTDGIDAAATLRFGRAFSLYNALSYNNSRYDENYVSGTATVLTAGKKVPGSPDWLNKTVATLDAGPFDLQLIGDYLGRRYATYTNDLVTVGDNAAKVPGYFTLSGRIAFDVPIGDQFVVHKLSVSLNVTNITNIRAASSLAVGAASGTYSFFPVAPRQYFGTVSAAF
ncbi:TonB-dependent receptor domain-containing protein, partial [uncultured Sphingomonas sp.]|uniref:TonB-dependent receptor domain-containing protein n=1 Tax=uncultured Sphingomonas sp. TaxID=158754 RepID=UPI0035CA7EE7